MTASDSGHSASRNRSLLMHSILAKGAMGLAVIVMFLFGLELWVPTLPVLDWTVVFGVFCLLPGYMLSLLLIPSGRLDSIQRWAVSFPLSLGVSLVPTVVVLALQSTLSILGLWLGIVSLLLYLAVLAFWNPSSKTIPDQRPRRLAIAGVGITVLVVMTASWVSAQYGPVQQDDWSYLSWVRNYLDSPHLSPADPYRGTGIDTINPRQYYDISLPWTAFLSNATGIEPDVIWWNYLRVTLSALSMLSFYALARVLLKSSVHAALACALAALLFLSDASGIDGLGGMFFFRMPQDKIVAWAVLLPVASFALVEFLETGTRGYWGIFALTTLAACNFSETAFVQIGLIVLSFVLVRMLAGHRTKSDWFAYALLGAVMLLAMALPVAGRLYASTLTVSAFDRSFEVLQEQLANRLLFLSPGVYIAHPKLLSSRITVAGLVLSPLLFRYVARETAAQFLLAVTGGVVVSVFNPVVAPLLGKLTYPGFVWRMVWIIPSVLIIAYLLGKLSGRVDSLAASSRVRLLFTTLAVTVAVLALLSPLKASAAKMTEFADPGQSRTLFSYGRDGGNVVLYPTAEAQRFLIHLRTSGLPGGIFLIHPDWSVMATALLPGAHIISVTGQGVGSEQLELPGSTRYHDAIGFFDLDRISSLEEVDLLQKYAVDYVVVESQASLAGSMSQIPSLFDLVYADQAYALYQVRLGNLSSPGGQALVLGDVFLQTMQWAEARESFEAALSASIPGSHSGMGRYHLSQHSLDEATEEFEAELAHTPGDLVALRGLAEAYYRRWQTDEALAVLEQVSQPQEADLRDAFLLAKLSERRGEAADPYWRRYLELVDRAGKPTSPEAIDLAKQRLASTLATDLTSALDQATTGSSLEPGEAIRREVTTIAGLELDALFMHPTSSASYLLTLPSGQVWLDWYVGLAPEAALLGQGDGVRFAVYLEEDGLRYLISSEYIDPKNIQSQRHWLHRERDISPWAGHTVKLTLVTDPGPNNDSRFDWALWGEPRIIRRDPAYAPNQ